MSYKMVSKQGIKYPDLQRKHLGLYGGRNSLEFSRELGRWKGIRAFHPVWV
jgi:hypothetical protein